VRFKKCENLEDLKFGANSRLELIEDLCFSGSGLVSIQLPQNLKDIAVSPLHHCMLIEGGPYREINMFLRQSQGRTIGNLN
jgi:hypothetical protein